eukprot:321001-Chlamydomonas_euryale.AAC.1
MALAQRRGAGAGWAARRRTRRARRAGCARADCWTRSWRRRQTGRRRPWTAWSRARRRGGAQRAPAEGRSQEGDVRNGAVGSSGEVAGGGLW